MLRTDMLKWRRESVLDIYNLLLALFLFVTPWLFAYANQDAKIDLWASSALIAVISFTTFIAFSNWEEWFNLLLGIWLVGSLCALGFTHTRAMHYSIGIGAVIAFGPDVLRAQLWLPAEALGAPGGGSGARVDRVRSWHRRRWRFGWYTTKQVREVRLRPEREDWPPDLILREVD